MEGYKYLWHVFTLLNFLTLVVSGKRPERDDDNGLLPRPTRSKGNAKPELFEDLPDSESSAQQVSPTVSGYQGNLAGQNGLLGNQGLYGQSLNPALAGQGQGINPYLSVGTGGLGTTNLGGGTFGVGTGFQNPYGFQDVYSQQAGFGGGLGGISQQSGFGQLNGNPYFTQSQNPYFTQAQNPYFTQGQNPYLVNPYFQQGTGGFSTQFGNPSVNPYLFAQRNTGYIQNPYFGSGGGSFGGFVNPYGGYSGFNPYNAFPLTSRFGVGVGRGSSLGGSRSNSGGTTTSSSDE